MEDGAGTVEHAPGDSSPGPGLGLDELLTQLIDRAQDVRSTQDRLRGLLQANQSIITNLALEVVLRRIVEAACELLEARYGALGVLSSDGHGLEQFIHVGIDQDVVHQIGDLPQGKGVLGALIEDPAPIRLRELSDDLRSVGFPDGHPPMHSFLGVPITIRGEVYGNLYLTERVSGDFSAEDVELASALAATAAVAIENARLFEDSRRRQEWLAAASAVALQIVTAPGDEPLRAVVEHIHQLARADIVTLVLPEHDNQRLAVAVAVGMQADRLEGTSYPLPGTLTEEVLLSGRPTMVASMEDRTDRMLHLRDQVPVGPAMVLPLSGRNGVRGALVVGRLASGRPFSASELEMATTFASHAALALEVVEARKDQDRVKLFEDRDRIARDLHDHVIQQLFAAGLTLQSISMGMTEKIPAEQIESVVESLDESIRQIRNSIFELRDQAGPQGPGVRAAVLEVLASVEAGLHFEPEVRFIGPVDTIVDAELAEDIVAVVREGLTNVARHANASRAEVALTASPDQVELRITDNGQGFLLDVRRSGLDNLASRALRRTGSFSAEPPPEGTGTVLTWIVPVGG